MFKTNWNWVWKVLKVTLRSGKVLGNLLEKGHLSVKSLIQQYEKSTLNYTSRIWDRGQALT